MTFTVPESCKSRSVCERGSKRLEGEVFSSGTRPARMDGGADLPRVLKVDFA